MSMMSYYITNEMKFRIKTSALLWCYYGTIFILVFPPVLVSVYFQQVVHYQSLLGSLFFLLLLFFPLNLDIFTRESQLNMLEYLTMSSSGFKIIYVARIIANAILMIIPACLGPLSLFVIKLPSLNSVSIVLDLVSLFLFCAFFYFWFLVALLVLQIIELKYPDSMVRVVLYMAMIFLIFFLLSPTISLQPAFIITGIITSLKLFENTFFTLLFILIIFFSLLFIMIGYLIIQTVLLLMISRRIEKITEMYGKNVKKSNDSIRSFYSGSHSFQKVLGRIRETTWRGFVPYLGIIFYLLIFSLVPDPMQRSDTLVIVYFFHLLVIYVYVLLVVFPRITIEKEFHMEELVLSRISSSRYFIAKSKLLMYSISKPLLIPTILLIFMVPDSISLIVAIVSFVIFGVSFSLFLWRLLPAKNLLQTTLLTVLGIEIMGLFFLYSSSSSMNIVVGNITVWVLTLAIISYFSTFVLIKADIRFD
ncbi:MAG: hypothetical protein ACXAEU_15075 [Candidatus Hodarchaeales archaeon]